MKLLNYTVLSILFLGIYSCSTKHKDVKVPISQWRIHQGDDMEWLNPGFDDSTWDTIGVEKHWDDYGYKDMAGYAWYRAKIFIPSSMKNSSFYSSDIVFELGNIDDADQTFLNGKLIGQNGTSVPEGVTGKELKEESYWKIIRNYKLSSDDNRILWDKENVITVRVWNGDGPGGIFNANSIVRLLSMADYVDIDNVSSVYEITNRKDFKKEFLIVNNATNITFKGKLIITVNDQYTGDVVYMKDEGVTLTPKEEKSIVFSFGTEPGQNCTTTYKYVDDKSGDEVIAKEFVPYLLTPAAINKPSINGPSLYGARPGNEFLYKIPVSGKKPIKYTVSGLPTRLKVDTITGIITGKTPMKGVYKIIIKAENQYGVDKKEFSIIAGDKLALTPLMGWNSWNCWGLSVSDEKIKISANEMIKSSLADYGFNYINIDDGWEASERTDKGVLMGNDKFTDFSALSKYVHSLGLKLGIYSGPGPYTCGGHIASYQHEYIDAKTWGEWGIDYLKYDWCAYESIAKDHSLSELKKPYVLMRKALNKIDRDIIYSLCQYGWGDVWKWGSEIGGELWRTTGDITDTWESLRNIGFQQYKMISYAKPGGWNDPDMLIVGWVGWSSNLHPTRLTPDEQYTHITLWSLLSAPLLLGNDMARLDDFTMNLLTNNEVLAINQDSLGKQADKLFDKDNIQYWLKELADGSFALGVFNLNDEVKEVKVSFKDIGLEGTYNVRDLWRQIDKGELRGSLDVVIPIHGSYMFKLSMK